MKELINFIKRHIKWFAIVNIVLMVGLVMLPVFHETQMMNIVIELNLFIQYIEYQSHSLTYAIVRTVVFIGIPTLTSVIGMFLSKYRFTLALPALSYLILIFTMFGFPDKLRHYFIGFYLAILIFAFFLFYYIADIIVHRAPKTVKAPKPKKPNTDERIAALEKEIEELKNKKDDQ